MCVCVCVCVWVWVCMTVCVGVCGCGCASHPHPPPPSFKNVVQGSSSLQRSYRYIRLTRRNCAAFMDNVVAAFRTLETRSTSRAGPSSSLSHTPSLSYGKALASPLQCSWNGRLTQPSLHTHRGSSCLLVLVHTLQIFQAGATATTSPSCGGGAPSSGHAAASACSVCGFP